jgi:alkanesulfonate monooxygenase SsuD/methylene tetrahydromethanopterin reductase-like flavin-dependent oxidoreductase (luciferase family)
MALKDRISFGVALPHRSTDAIDIAAVRDVAQRADALGFCDLWVTENTLDHVFCFDSVVALTYAAAVTTTIRLGVSMIVLAIHHPVHLAHQIATLDYVSNGRAILGAGLGRDHHYAQFQVPREQRVRRFRESVELIKSLWTESKVSYHGSIFQLDGASLALKPVQKPRPPIWFGGAHPDAIRRSATIADGWIGAGGSSMAAFARNISILKAELERARRDWATFPISKRVFLSVHERSDVARAELHRWFGTVYHNPEGTDASGIYGTPEQLRARIEELVATGANHLLLNPVCRYAEQLEALAEVVGLR